MSRVEDEIRASLRSEAARLREVRHLRLPPETAHPAPHRALRDSRLRLPSAWLAPAAVAAAIVLVAAALVTVRALENSSAAPASSTLGGGATVAAPRYYVGIGSVSRPGGHWNYAIVAGDAQTGKRVGYYTLPAGNRISWAASGAADDRTFVVSAAVFKYGPHTVAGPARWYLVRVFPGSADPVRVTPLAIQATSVTSTGTDVISIALSAGGTQLAVVSNTGSSVGLAVFSVATGKLRHSWSIGMRDVPRVDTPVIDPSWVGDETVGFAFIGTPNVREEVRTLDVSSAGSDLLADSHVVWVQYVHPPAGGKYGKSTPRTCDTPFLTGDGQTVVCTTSSYSATDKRLSAVWLAYPVATPSRPRVIGSVTEPRQVTGFVGPNVVEWVNSSGTEVIGAWFPEVTIGRGVSVASYQAFIGHGRVRPFTAEITGGPPLPIPPGPPAW
jgi:hypothetical protein